MVAELRLVDGNQVEIIVWIDILNFRTQALKFIDVEQNDNAIGTYCINSTLVNNFVI